MTEPASPTYFLTQQEQRAVRAVAEVAEQIVPPRRRPIPNVGQETGSSAQNAYRQQQERSRLGHQALTSPVI